MQRIIVGTGRCGSTLVSSLLAYHPDVFVVHELFGGMDFDMLRSGQVSGSELADILLRDHINSNLNISRAQADKEIVLDGFMQGQRIPKAMLATIPHWTTDAAGLMKEMAVWARLQKTRPLSEHYPALFDWLTAMFNKKCWVERSGGSAEYFSALRKTFPNARYLHLHRDGAEVALSMREHAYFASHISFYFNPPDDKEIGQMIRNDTPANDPFSRRLTNKPAPEFFGKFWTTSICLLKSQVEFLEKNQYREINFEDLYRGPLNFLKEICDYFELSSDPAWMEPAIATIKPQGQPRFGALSQDDQARLAAAVLPGHILLNRHGSLQSPNFDTYGRMRRMWDDLAPQDTTAYTD